MTSSSRSSAIPIPVLAFPALLLGNAVLAAGPLLVKLADVGPVAAGFWRLALAIPLLLFLARRSIGAIARLGVGAWAKVAAAGLFFAADLASWHLGILHTKVANAAIFGNVSALLLPLWTWFVLRERLRPVQALAIALAMAGAAILMGGSYEASPRNLSGDLLCTLAGVLYTGYILLIQDARRSLTSWSVLALSSIAGVLPLLAFAGLMGERILPGVWWPVIALALSSQVIGQGLMVYAMGWFSPLVLGLSLLLQPAVAALLGWIVLGEQLTLLDMVGGLAVGVALVLVRLPARA